MALTTQNSGWISRAMDDAQSILRLRAYWEAELGMWNLNDMFNVLNDSDISEQFKHLTKGEVTAYVNVIKALLVALGSADGNGDPVHNDVSGHAANLIKMKG